MKDPYETLGVTPLSVEERRVSNGLTNGQSTASIAQDLRLVPRTVEIHRANLMTKMQASGLSDLVRMAIISSNDAKD